MRDIMARGHLVPAEEAVLLTRSSIRCAVVDDVFKTMRDGTGRVVDLDRVEVPTLVAWGDKDRLLPMDRHSERFRREIPGVQFRGDARPRPHADVGRPGPDRGADRRTSRPPPRRRGTVRPPR